MEQLEFFAVPSPCVGVCSMDEKGYCRGCMRRREERFNWLSMTPAEQRHVIRLCKQRYRRKKGKNQTLQSLVDEPLQNPQQELF